ncbi:Flagellar P-ring protein [Candidatus Terasakiella magnetica]|nr:Flagellar P-ring protein [Candidatus Terasakiella magnetica]
MRLALVTLLGLGLAVPVLAQSRIKDIANVQDLGEAVFTGYGAVAGLAGTGDSALASRGTITPGARVGRDTAAVMVTVRLAPGVRVGSRADVSVAAVGDARSLNGGILVPTALEGSDRQIYAVAAGPVATGGISAQSRGQSISRGSTTTGIISSGAMVERDLPLSLGQGGEVRFLLHNPDFTTAKRLSDTINTALGRFVALARDNASVTVRIPPDYPNGAVGLIAAVEGLPLQSDRPAARLVIDARSGSIISGHDIPLAPVAISHGGLTIQVTQAPRISQPGPFSSTGRTVVAQESRIEVSEGGGQMVALPPGSTLGDLLKALRAAEIPTLDQISILQSLRAAGSFDAEMIAR